MCVWVHASQLFPRVFLIKVSGPFNGNTGRTLAETGAWCSRCGHVRMTDGQGHYCHEYRLPFLDGAGPCLNTHWIHVFLLAVLRLHRAVSGRNCVAFVARVIAVLTRSNHLWMPVYIGSLFHSDLVAAIGGASPFLGRICLPPRAVPVRARLPSPILRFWLVDQTSAGSSPCTCSLAVTGI